MCLEQSPKRSLHFGMSVFTKGSSERAERDAALQAAIKEQAAIISGTGNVIELKPSERAPKRKPSFYPVDARVRRLHTSAKKRSQKQRTRLRNSIQPGTVLIMLAGRFRGKRVVFLRQLEHSGLLLVTGPFALNGVPLRRVNQVYVIATKTRVDVSGIDTSSVDDTWFTKGARKAREERKKARLRGADGSGGESTARQCLPEEKKNLQKQIDGQVMKAVEGIPLLREYLSSRFTLTKGQYPHRMTF